MLRFILIAVLAVCSTCLVRPWFWKKVREDENFLKYFNNTILAPDSIETWIVYKAKAQLALAIGVWYPCLWVHSEFYCRQNFYGYWVFIVLCLIIQFSLFPPKKKIGNIIMVLGIILILVCGIQDSIVKNDITIPLNKVDCVDGLYHINGKYIFTVSGGDTGNGVAVIDKDNYDEPKILPCSYELNISNIYSKYSTQRIKALYITISDDDVPYGLFAVADKDWLLGTYKVSSYVMFNLQTGEIQEYTQEQLPSYATNN